MEAVGTGPLERCRWCGDLTDLRFAPTTGSRIGPVPLHILCSGQFLRAVVEGRMRLDGHATPSSAAIASSSSSTVPSPRSRGASITTPPDPKMSGGGTTRKSES